MARPDKAATVAELSEQFRSSEAAVLTEYRGLSVAALKQLRRALGDDASYAVTKNTLTKIAARDAGMEGLDDLLVGPTAIAFITGDVAGVAKGLRDFAKANPALVIKGGVMEGRFLDAEQVKKLADLESREVLLARLAGGMQATLQQAVSLLAAPLAQAARGFGALQTAAEADPSLIAGAGEEQNPVEAAPAAETDAAPAADPDAAAAADTDAADAAQDK